MFSVLIAYQLEVNPKSGRTQVVRYPRCYAWYLKYNFFPIQTGSKWIWVEERV